MMCKMWKAILLLCFTTLSFAQNASNGSNAYMYSNHTWVTTIYGAALVSCSGRGWFSQPIFHSNDLCFKTNCAPLKVGISAGPYSSDVIKIAQIDNTDSFCPLGTYAGFKYTQDYRLISIGCVPDAEVKPSLCFYP